MHSPTGLVFLTILGSLVLAAPSTPHVHDAGPETAQSVPAINVSVTGTAGLVTSIVLAIMLLLLRIAWRGVHIGDTRRPSRRRRRIFLGPIAAPDGPTALPVDPMVAAGSEECDASLSASALTDVESTGTSTGLDVSALGDEAVAE